MSFRAEIMQAAREGVLLSVKWVIGLAIVALASQVIIRDYLVTRTLAQRGEAAAVYIEKALAEQQKAQAQKPPEAPK